MFIPEKTDLRCLSCILATIICINGCTQGSTQSKDKSPAYYSRSDCIVEFLIESNVNNVEKLNSLVFDSFFSSPNKDLIGAIVYPEALGGGYYVQFNSRCEERLHLTERLLAEMTKSKKIISYAVNNKRISPSPFTIDAKGPAWVD